MTDSGVDARVLVVDDEAAVADMAALQLQRRYDVETAYGGREALERLDETVDVVLLDRRMPDLSGDEVLSRIRDDGRDCRVVVLSAVSPDYDILEMPFDDYLCKPVAGDPLMTAVEQQVATLGDERLGTYLSLVATRDLLETAKPNHELEEHDGYQDLLRRLRSLRDELDGRSGLAERTELFAGIERT